MRNGVLIDARLTHGRRRGLAAWITTAWLIAFLVVLALTLYRYLMPFIPSARWLGLANLPAFLVAVALSLPLLLFTPRMHFARVRDRFIWHVSRVLSVPAVSFVLWQGLLIGLPAAAHHFTNPTESMQTFSVEASASHYYRYSLKFGRCAGKVYLASDIRFLDLRVCGVPEDDWHRVEPADPIELYGAESWFGLEYTAVRALW